MNALDMFVWFIVIPISYVSSVSGRVKPISLDGIDLDTLSLEYLARVSVPVSHASIAGGAGHLHVKSATMSKCTAVSAQHKGSQHISRPTNDPEQLKQLSHLNLTRMGYILAKINSTES